MTLPPERHRQPWTEKEDSYLQWNWGEKSAERIAKRLKRTTWAVVRRAVTLQLGPFSRGTYSMKEIERLSGFSVPKIRQATRKLGLNVEYARSRFSKRIDEYAFDHDQVMRLIDFMLKNPVIYRDAPGDKKTTRGIWGVGMKGACCLRCGRNDRSHYAKGLCRLCYEKPYKDRQRAKEKQKRRANRNKITRVGRPRVLTEDAVLVIRDLRFSGLTYVEIAKRIGVGRNTVTSVCRGATWKHVGGPVEPYATDVVHGSGDEHSQSCEELRRGRGGDP